LTPKQEEGESRQSFFPFLVCEEAKTNNQQYIGKDVDGTLLSPKPTIQATLWLYASNHTSLT